MQNKFNKGNFLVFSFFRYLFLSFVLVLELINTKVVFARTYASIVMEASSGKVLHEVNANEAVYPASLTKMMTLYLTFQALEQKKFSWDQLLSVSSRAQHQEPGILGLKKGEKITVKNAVLGVITKSANDAAVVLAEALGKTEPQFASMMTRTAQKIGLHHTTFKNASGLPDKQQKTTARDMALLAQALYKRFPKYYAYFKKEMFHFRGAAYKNHNRLLGKVKGVDGVKTGFINASGFNLAASVSRNNKRLIVIVMGGKTSKWRDNHITQLIDTAYQAPHALPIITASLKSNKQKNTLTIPSLISQAYAESSQENSPSIERLIQASAQEAMAVKPKKQKSLKKKKVVRLSQKSKKASKKSRA